MKEYGLSYSVAMSDLGNHPDWGPTALLYLSAQNEYMERQMDRSSGGHRMTGEEFEQSSDEVKAQWAEAAKARSKTNMASADAALRKKWGPGYDKAGF